MTRTIVALFVSVTAASMLAAQSQTAGLAFEAAVIRPNTSGASGGGGGPRPGGRYIYTNVSPRALIGSAFRIPSNRIFGAPDWVNAERYDINAIGKEGATSEESSQMMLALLRDRFRMQARVEQRELPVYWLSVARPDGRLGAGLRPSAIDCSDLEARKKAAATARPGGRVLCGFSSDVGVLRAGGTDMGTLASIVTSSAGRPVLDRTGLKGGYDIDLNWTAVLQQDTPDAVSIFTAVQEQLGLKLDSGTAPLDVIVIDRIERPTEN